jgi:hypothetical protein
MFHPKEARRLEKLERLDDRSGDKYCWAQLVYLGMFKYEGGEELEDIKESCRAGNVCKGNSLESGSCWCNKFIDGKIRLKESVNT